MGITIRHETLAAAVKKRAAKTAAQARARAEIEAQREVKKQP